MKTVIWGVILVLAFSCSEKVEEVQYSNLTDHHMKIIPDKPNSNDEIMLVILGDCTYNVLSGITRNGNTIDVVKQFNSMMKWPCVMQNDTIKIGKLPEGNYTVNYKLMDTSTQVTDPVSVSFSFQLPVTKQ